MYLGTKVQKRHFILIGEVYPFQKFRRDNKRIKDQSKADMETRNLQTLLAKWANSKFYKTLDKEIKSG